jgi:hypothetical protein
MLFKNKKAQGLSITVIIVAVIALLVLIILALVFTGGLGRFGLKVADCENKQGKCAEACGSDEAGTLDYPTEFPEWKCAEEDEKCCVTFV